MADPDLPAWPALDIERRHATPPNDDYDDRLALAFDDLDVTALESDREGHCRAYFASRAARDAACATLREAFGDETTITPTEVPDEGWAVKVQSTLGAIRVGGIVVAPPWDRASLERGTGAESQGAAAAEPLVVVIEPSMGFGTGHHQSTRLCLGALQRTRLTGRTVLDVGTGSGVLAIAAAYLGAARVVAIDNDPDAVVAARENTARNAVAPLVDVRLEDLGVATSLPRADVVVANLTANVIRRLARPLVALVAPGGCLIASGFTYDQVDLVREALAPLALVTREDEDDWVAVVFE